ncbi:MAG TPA: class I SAM-dependent methyltransferase [Burkholderiaceae bacterium]|nr:class I SAM-dependent methyltransferase [Burkholderiaceae bacterium]
MTAALASTTAHAQDEVPFVTSPHPVTMAMLKLARVQASDVVLDLGSGDGRIVIAAARQFGARGVGVELSPQLVQTSRDNALRAGVAGRTQFVVQDLFETDLAQASVITMYLLPEVNLQLRPKLLALRAGTRIVSHDWDMGDWQPDRTVVVDAPDKPVGLEKKSRVHLWVVPAPLGGAWCAAGHALRLEQTYQELRGEWTHGASAPTAIESRVQGRVVQLVRPDGRARLALHDAQLRVEAASGAWSALRGVVFSRGAEGCR